MYDVFNTRFLKSIYDYFKENGQKQSQIKKTIYMHKGVIPVPYGSICCTYHQLKYSYPNRSRKTTTKATQKSLPFGKRRFREKEVRRMGQKQKRRATGLGRRKKDEV